MMEHTYTYTARNPDDPSQVLTFTLYDHSLVVDLAAPLEQVERTVEAVRAARDGGDATAEKIPISPWLKPAALSMLEQRTHPFNVDDIDASVSEDRLRVRAWFRSGGLRVVPITLLRGRVDNPVAAQDFVDELRRRRNHFPGLLKLFSIFDYWLTWFVTGFAAVILFQLWRDKRSRDTA